MSAERHSIPASEMQKSLEEHSDFEEPHTEGTLRGWLGVLGGSLVLMSTFGNLQSFGVYQDFYTREFLSDFTPSQISWIGSVPLALQFIVGAISGKLFDKGFFHALMVTGSLLLLFSSFMLSLAQPQHFYQVILSQGVGMGIAMGILLLPSLGLVSQYFRKQRAVAMGILIASGALGAVIYPILLNHVIGKPGLGFPWAVRFVAFINLGQLVTANLIMKPRAVGIRREPVDMGQIWHDSPYWITNVSLFLGFWGIFFPYFYLQLFSGEHGVSPNFLTWAIPLLNAGATLGRFTPNFVADRYGSLNVIIPSGLLSGGLVWALLGAKTTAGVTIFALAYGFVSGAFLTLATPAVAAFSQSPTLNDVGLRMGIGCLFIGVAVLTGNPIAGSLLDPPRDLWWRPLTFSCTTLFAGTSGLVVARQALVKRKGVQYV